MAFASTFEQREGIKMGRIPPCALAIGIQRHACRACRKSGHISCAAVYHSFKNDFRTNSEKKSSCNRSGM
eukprot:2647661-Amphidinium_carterae.2